ncbi:hypothetical protein OMP40_25260 [Cohnella rhizosphaerae]|uniref:Uncharacterized protein n=1 Tax=Cohnella rhizosphaerae TaxID=1457232 RepID=A0A9X4QUI1_9BACL|nr:hypothetical protein [Cohnella rhizosphaerae]MDG0812291.1 hypothetical protein [Cohnella rhizosphaerae]
MPWPAKKVTEELFALGTAAEIKERLERFHAGAAVQDERLHPGKR